MKALCITGFFQQDLARIDQLLRQAGMQPAIPAQRDADMEAWHAQAHAAYEQALDPTSTSRRSSRKRGKKRAVRELQLDPQGRVTPGTVLEQQASDIFSANQATHSSPWGWADCRSIPFLDFWVAFDAGLQFILICEAPEQLFARALAAGTVSDPAQLEEQLAAWHAQHEALLRFHHRHRERSVLVDMAAVAAQPQAFLQHLNERWPDLALAPAQNPDTDTQANPNTGTQANPNTGTQANPDTDTPVSLDTVAPAQAGAQRLQATATQSNTGHPGTLATWLAQLGLEAYPPVRILQQELAATQVWLGEAEEQESDHDEPEQPALAELIADYGALRQQISEHRAQAEQLAHTEQQLTQTLQAAQQQLAALEQARATAEQQRDEQTSTLHSSNQRLQDQQRASEVLQAQLRQLQEELEAASRQTDSLRQQHAALQQQASERQAQLEQQASTQQTQLEQLASEKTTQAAALQRSEQRLQDQQHESELLLAQLHQVQEELEAAFKQADTTKQQLAEQEQTRITAEQERSAHQAQLAQLAKEKAAQAEALQTTEQRLQDQQHESELLLVQLHQVQEELEATFKQAETSKQQLAALEQARATVQQERDKQAARHATLQQEHIQLGKQANERQAQVEKLSKEKGEQTKLALERQNQLQQLNQAKQGLEKELAAIRANPPQNQAQAEALQATELRLQDQQQESELLLLQLHQVQEELEALFIQHESTKQRLEATSKAQADTEQARLKLDKLANERQAQIHTLSQERNTQASQAKARQEQVVQLGKEKEQLAREKAQLAQQLAQANTQRQQDNAALQQAKAQRESDQAALQKTQAQWESDKTALQQANAQWRDQQQENELLLLQLHQVQEELEHSFTQGLEQKQQLTQWQQRWQRMLQRNPDYCDFGILQLEACDDKQRCSWLLKDVALAGRSFPELRFHTVLENGCAGIEFSRAADGTQPLLRWAGTPQQHSIILLPLGTRAQLQERIGVLLNLGTQDWQLLQALPPLLLEALAQNTVQALPANCDVAALRKGLEALQTRLQAFPDVPRYDQLDLVHEQVNPDYEHLWLRMTNLSLGTESWPSFEFRLSCAHVRPGEFGLFPKLEFPEGQGQAPFDSWFAESYDDFGAKCELRFALKAGSLDMQVWQQLSQRDRGYIHELSKLLPTWLGTLQHQGMALQRPWQDWQQMARNTQKIIRAVRDAAEAESANEAEPANVDILAVASLPQAPEQLKQQASRKAAASRTTTKRTASRKPTASKPAAPVRTRRSTKSSVATEAR